MANQIDHIIIAVDGRQHEDLSEQLKAAGFVHGDAGKHPGGTANENVAFAGGGFLELLYEQSPGNGPRVWFGDTPRVQGIGISTAHYEADIAAWGRPPESWDQMFDKVLDTGEESQCRAAGPLARNEFYVFYMDRPRTDFVDLGATARLTDIIFRGRDERLWRNRFRMWFGLPERDDGLQCGDVRFRFEPGGSASIRLSLRFEVQQAPSVFPISGGEIELALATNSTGPGGGNS
jgi:hypothetical protein